MKLPEKVGKSLCKVGLHKFRVIEVKFGFGGAGKVEVVECTRCGVVATRRAK